MESESVTPAVYCYCEKSVLDPHMFTCSNCEKLFHINCLKSEKPSHLIGDIYFNFVCANCSEGSESFERIRLQWTTVLILTLYNLQLQGGGKCGFFRWREHVCRFIDKNWTLFFGATKKQSATWHGTVAGCLSNGANRFFVSGAEILGETGWWTLKSTQLPTLREADASNLLSSKPSRKRKVEEKALILEGSRKKNSNVLEAALSLKERKACFAEDTKSKVKRKHWSKDPILVPQTSHKLKLIVPETESLDSEGSPKCIPKIIIKTERSISPRAIDETWMRNSEDLSISEDFSNSTFELPSPPDTLNSVMEDYFSDIKTQYESEGENSNSDKKIVQHSSTSRKKKAVTKEEVKEEEESSILNSKYTMMSPYEEQLLMARLENYHNQTKVRRLYRKLAVRNLKREKNIIVFNIDAEVRSIRGMDPPEYCCKKNIKSNTSVRMNSILDRYHLGPKNKLIQCSSFITRLMGLEDEQHGSIVSPYTERILKPFIFRDYKTRPPKLRLLDEILKHTNKYPIDYCYVRPQHIPAINALCHQFFWPGIDMSESLQYPDFSCVVLYRKVIIAFAFMVPDVKYNEAYITFVFVHPEWRQSGIATFMLYHLIQTCMGKDVTLHVSATSSAVFLYQKFGFKVEEFIYDFYDKYLPLESKECRHALFLRLSR